MGVSNQVAKLSKQDILSLYRALLKGRRTFVVTDKQYYTQLVRKEFKARKNEKDSGVAQKYFQAAKKVLENNFGGFV